MDHQALRKRTMEFALRVMRLVDALPQSRASEVIGRQLIRSATSVFANYRATKRARSNAECIAKMGVVEEEADESEGWLELIVQSKLMDKRQVAPLLTEAGELTAIAVASIKTAKRNRRKLRE
jgi:four helix bundle protein